MKRPWAADAFLNDVTRFFVFGSDSLTSMISNSHLLTAEFQRRIDQMEDCPVTNRRNKSLVFAKQRLDTGTKPMGGAWGRHTGRPSLST